LKSARKTNEDTIYVNFFVIFETAPAQICADFLEIRIHKKKIKGAWTLIKNRSRVAMAYHYENNELTDMLQMNGQYYQNAAVASREYVQRFSE
jgi:hypothetical protein